MADGMVVITAIVIMITIVVLALVVWRYKKSFPESTARESARSFLIMGILWMLIAAAATYFVHGTESLVNGLAMFELTLFNLGLIFFLIGITGMGMERYKSSRKVSLIERGGKNK